MYVQSNTLSPADVFENFRNMCCETYDLDPGLEWETVLKKTKIKLDLLTDISILLMIEKGDVTLFIDMQKLITIIWMIMIRIKNRHIFNIGIKVI